MHCPNCGESVTEGAEACGRCGLRVTWADGEVTFAEPVHWVNVFTAWDAATLPIIESLLESNGIPFTVANDVTQDLIGWGRAGVGYNPVFGPPLVKVSSDREQEVRALIEASATAPLTEEPPAE